MYFIISLLFIAYHCNYLRTCVISLVYYYVFVSPLRDPYDLLYFVVINVELILELVCVNIVSTPLDLGGFWIWGVVFKLLIS